MAPQHMGLATLMVLTLLAPARFARPAHGDQSGMTDVDERGRVFTVSQRPGYWRDPRLAREIAFPPPPKSRQPEAILYGVPDLKEVDSVDFQPVRLLDGQVLTGRAAAEHIARATGVSLLLQGSYSRSLLTVPNSGVPARELMDSMARVLLGKWHLHRDSWVLVQHESNLPLVTLPTADRNRERAANIRRLVGLLQEGQWNILGRRGTLGWEDLTRDQKMIVFRQLQLDFHDPERMREQAPLEDALFGKTVSLRLTGAGVTARFGIACLGADGRPYTPSSPFYHPQTRELTWGVLPPR